MVKFHYEHYTWFLFGVQFNYISGTLLAYVKNNVTDFLISSQ